MSVKLYERLISLLKCSMQCKRTIATTTKAIFNLYPTLHITFLSRFCILLIWALGSIISRQRGINKTYQKVSWTPKVCAWVPMWASSYLFLMDSYLTSSHGKDHPMISCVYFEFHRSKLYAEKVLCLKLHIISIFCLLKMLLIMFYLSVGCQFIEHHLLFHEIAHFIWNSYTIGCFNSK
jgi:hypothetical protein